jgi:uncharacterized protein (DUF885 family)
VGATSGPLDPRLQELVEEHFQYLLRALPVAATFMGIHSEDHRLGDASRDGVEDRIAHERRLMAQLEGLDTAGLSEPARFEREIALHGARLDLFDLEERREWEQRPSAMEEIGDAVFSILSREFAPLPDRLESIASRLEGVPVVLAQHRARLGDRLVQTWNELELGGAEELPALFDEVVGTARGVWPEGSPALRRIQSAASRASLAVDAYAAWLRARTADASATWSLGRERYEQLVELRALDGLTADDILALGEDQLEANRRARREAALALDPDAEELAVVHRLKEDHPATFEEALAAYRDAMLRARRHVLDRGLATLPPGETLSVEATPEYLRRAAVPFAAYLEPARFDPRPAGIYMVTPSVNGGAAVLREHYRASISNTSIHEAYPGHHVQLSAANTHPSLARALVQAPEFIEGWAMYGEQMMREQGFDNGPAFMVALYTDAIWRACRVVLDVRMQRGEMTVAEATEFLAARTGFERANAQAEVLRYTYTPTYPLSYLVGKVLLLRLRDDEQRRLGPAFSLRRFHDQLLYSGSLPIAFHRRLLAGEGGGSTLPPMEADAVPAPDAGETGALPATGTAPADSPAVVTPGGAASGA